MIKGKSYDHKGKSYTYTQIAVKPQFKGGDEELIRYLQWNINYPWEEKNKGIQEKVIVGFITDETGRVKDPKIVYSVSSGLDKEALRVVRELPRFKPALIRGQPISFYFNLPIAFKLR